jgi:DNA-binding response OmpR family regulator
MFRILIVDDAPAIRQLVRRCIALHHRVSEAENAEQALHRALLHVPDLVVLDIGLPGPMDGLDLLGAMRRHERLARVPVVILSGRGLHGETCGLPIEAFFTKPFHPDELAACIERVLQVARAEQAAQPVRL